MFIDRFYEWYNNFVNGDNIGNDVTAVIIIGSALVWLGALALLIFTAMEMIIWALIITVLFSEWAYFSKLMRSEKKHSTVGLVGYKIGYILGAFPFITYPIVAMYNYQYIIKWFTKPEIMKEVIFLFSIIGIIGIIILFFVINVKIGKKITENNQKNKKRGK